MDRSIIGVISDTHGMLREEAVSQLADCDHIIHGGDIGKYEVIEKLRKIAPVIAVRGNCDKYPWGEEFPLTKVVKIKGINIFIIHDINMLRLEELPVDIHIIISGHSHKPDLWVRGNVNYLNPGSIGPRRFKLPVSMAKIVINHGNIDIDLITLFE